MHSFSLLLLSNLALFSTRTYACDDCWEWPEDDAVFQDEILSATNTYRAQHNASPLVWNETLAEGADGYVYGCKNYVPYHGPYGENKNVGYNSPALTVAAWAEGRESYDFGAGVSSPESANFTQLVWKSSTQMGCRRNVCDSLGYLWGWFVICYYSPKGNVEGEFVANVQARGEGDESTTSSVESPTSTLESPSSTLEASTSTLGSSTSTLKSAISSIGTPTSSVGNAPTGSPVANTTSGPVGNASATGPMASATSTPPVIDYAGAANGIRNALPAFWVAGVVGSLVVWAV